MRAGRARTINRLLILAAFGALGVAGAGVAKADAVDDYTVQNARLVCSVIDQYPAVSGVEGIAAAILDEGFTPVAVGEIIGRSVIGWCPRHAHLIDAFIAKYERAGTRT